MKLVVAAALLWVPPLTGQEVTDETRRIAPLRSVIEHRVLSREDSTSFDACTIWEELGQPDDLARTLGPTAARVLTPAVEECGEPRENSGRWIYPVDFLIGSDWAVVVLRVVSPHRTYFERYELRYSPEGNPWLVEEVRLFGWAFFG